MARNAMVGMNAVVMDGAVIGESSIVGAAAFVKIGMQVPPRSLVLGAPARVVRDLSDEDIAGKTWGTRQYHKPAQRSMQTMRAVAPLARPQPNRTRLESPDIQPSGDALAS